MGRAILIVVILVSTIYAGIIINVQKEMYKLPGVIVDNFINKEVENVNDYALRAAVRLGTENWTLPTGRDTLTVYFDGLTGSNPIYRQGHCKIDKIFYHRIAPHFYEARTYVSGSLQGHAINYTGQIAYDYPDAPGSGPLLLYNEYSAQTHANQTLPDHSDNPAGPMPGRVCAIGDNYNNVTHYSPQGLDKYFAGGGGTHKCIQFGAAHTNGNNHSGGWVQTPNPLDANYTTLLDRLKNYNQFTVALYAIPQKVKNSDRNTTNTGSLWVASNKGNVGTLYWAASNPNNSKFGQPGYTRPSAAIWYDSYVEATSTVTMHYGITINDGTADGQYYEIPRPGCPIFSNINSGVWHMYTLVFNNGVLTAYYDTDVVDSIVIPGGFTSIMPNDYGFTLGMRDIRADTPTSLVPTQIKHFGTNYMFYNGLLDQISFWDSALTSQEVENWFNNYVDRTAKYYIRD